VLWVSHLIPYPPKAGVLLRSYNLLKQVATKHEIHLVTFVQESWMRTFYSSVDAGVADAREHLGQICTVRECVPVPTDRLGRLGKVWLAGIGLLPSRCYSVDWLRSSQMRQTLRALARESWDVVHFDTIGLAQYRKLFTAIGATLGHHNIESHMMGRRADQEPNALLRAYMRLEARKLAKYERNVARSFDCHITCSSLDTHRLAQLVPGIEATDVPNGVDCEYFKRGTLARDGLRPSLQASRHDLVFVGTMDWYPNATAIEFFLKEVWPLLRSRRPNMTIGIVGSNPSPWLRQMGDSLQGVTVYGYVDDVRPYMESAAIYVCPIRDGGGTKLKILDAMAMSCCIVTHPIACEGIDVQDGRDVRFASAPSEFVDAIESLLDAPNTRSQMGQRARETAERLYSYDSLGQRLSDLWSDVTLRRASAGREHS
jgi:glycosyltransferase involved in cell wall biosynthesis